MKIIYFGTPKFAAYPLEILNKDPDIEIEAVVTQPDRPQGRKQVMTPPFVKAVAEDLDLKVLQPNNKSELKNMLEKFTDIDFYVVVAYGMIINKEILEMPEVDCINIHGSILPHYRGASPIQESLKNGDKETGVTIMQMDEKLDHGSIYLIHKIKIEESDNSETLSEKLSVVGGQLLPETLKEIKNYDLQPIPQKHEQATYCKKINKNDGEINWEKMTAEEILNLKKAYTPWPGIFFKKNQNKVKIIDAKLSNKDLASGEFLTTKDEIIVGTKKGSITIHKLQMAGKKPTNSSDFLNGYRDLFS